MKITKFLQILTISGVLAVTSNLIFSYASATVFFTQSDTRRTMEKLADDTPVRITNATFESAKKFEQEEKRKQEERERQENSKNGTSNRGNGVR